MLLPLFFPSGCRFPTDNFALAGRFACHSLALFWSFSCLLCAYITSETRRETLWPLDSEEMQGLRDKPLFPQDGNDDDDDDCPGKVQPRLTSFSSFSCPLHQAWPLFVVAGGAGLWYAKENGLLDDLLGGVPAISSSTTKPNDYDAVRKAIVDILDAEGYDDGSYGPVLVRLAWHCSGTYDAKTNSGGSNGAAMRFDPEASHGANAGLAVARSLLEPIKKKFPWLSYADLYTLAGAVAVEEMGGPKIEWAPGRSDFADGSRSCQETRLPDASQGAKHLRAVFTSGMGFDDREIVALSGAHSLGRCHTDRSGFEGPWTRAPTTFSSLYFNELVSFHFFFGCVWWGGAVCFFFSYFSFSRPRRSSYSLLFPSSFSSFFPPKKPLSEHRSTPNGPSASGTARCSTRTRPAATT